MSEYPLARLRVLGVPALCLALLTGLLPARALAGPDSLATSDANHLYDRFQLSATGTLVVMNTSLRIDADDGSSGTEVDLEDDLGYSKNIVEPRMSLRWRPGRRHELELSYLLARRTADKTLDRSIEIADTTFDAGAHIQSQFDSDYALLTYRFAFSRRENRQIGAGLGVGAYFFKYVVDALISSSGGGELQVDYSAEKNITGPTGTLGLYGRFRVGEAWYIETDARALYAPIDRYTIRVYDINAAARYYFSRKLCAEAGYGLSAINVDIGPKTDGGWQIINLDVSGDIKFSQQNLRLGLVWSF